MANYILPSRRPVCPIGNVVRFLAVNGWGNSVVTLSAFRLFGVSRPLSVVAKPLLGRKQWVGEYVRH